MVDTSYQQTRDSIGHTDQTRDLVFAGTAKEKVKVKVVNEVMRVSQPEGYILGHPTFGILGSQRLGTTGRTIVVEVIRRQWNWKNYDELKESPSNTGVLVDGGVTVDLTIE